MENKKIVRKQLLQKRKDFFEKEGAYANDLIYNKIIESPLFQNAKNILSYASYGTEVETRKLNEYSLRIGKNLFLPITDTSNHRIQFHKIDSLDELVPGYKGILQPKDMAPIWLPSQDTTMVIMPGVGFDQLKHRMGYGGGYYDRFLFDHPGLTTIMIAFSISNCENLPVEATDMDVDYIITEQEWFI